MADNYFIEEMKTSNLGGVANKIELAVFSFAVALTAAALNAFFVLLSNTVVDEMMPSLSSLGFFASGIIYNALILVLIIIIFILRYHSLTFAEMTTNRWYMLRKTGNSSGSIVFTKLFAMLGGAVLLYLLGFSLLLIICLVFGMNMELSSAFSLLTIGLFQVIVAVSFIMTLSMFVKKRRVAFMLTLITVCIINIISLLTGFYDAYHNAVIMSDAAFVFTGTTGIYFYILLFGSALILATGSVYASVNANNYTTYGNLNAVRYEDCQTVRPLECKPINYFDVKKALKTVLSAALCTLLFFGIAGSVALVIFATPASKNGNITGKIPMTFASDTMSGKIERNDFVVFKKIPITSSVQIGDVVLYLRNGQKQVRVVRGINRDGSLQTDYETYPDGYAENSGKETVKREEVIARMQYTDRWSGAWLRWCSTAAGVVFTIVLPVWILIFRKRLAASLKLLAVKLDFNESRI